MYLILDFETTTLKKYGRKANPFCNSIVAKGLKYENKKDPIIHYLEDYYWSFYLKDVSIIVGHNLEFDLLYIWKDKDFQDWLISGGVIWDTSIAHYSLQAQQDRYPELRDIAVKYYNCPYREKLMEPYWEKGIDTKDIPRELCIQDVTLDVLDTESIYKQQVTQAKKVGMYVLLQQRMEGLLATIEMTYNGMAIDQEELGRNRRELETQIEQKKKVLYMLVSKYWV